MDLLLRKSPSRYWPRVNLIELVQTWGRLQFLAAEQWGIALSTMRLQGTHRVPCFQVLMPYHAAKNLPPASVVQSLAELSKSKWTIQKSACLRGVSEKRHQLRWLPQRGQRKCIPGIEIWKNFIHIRVYIYCTYIYIYVYTWLYVYIYTCLIIYSDISISISISISIYLSLCLSIYLSI